MPRRSRPGAGIPAANAGPPFRARAEANRRAILRSESYILAEEDTALLKRDELRPVRLQLELLKPELAFLEHKIRSTIVVFGSTRVVEEEVAEKRLADLRKLAARSPRDAGLRRRLGIAERVLAKARYYEEARRLAHLVSRISQRADRRELVVVTGGGPGIMEAANRGSFEAGAMSIGLNITLPLEQEPNPYIDPELCFQFHYFAIRKMHFLMRAKALVAFPGGFGTMDELFEALTLLQTRKIQPLPVVLVGREYWESLVNFQGFVDEGTVAPEDVDLFQFAETAEEIWDLICAFHRLNPQAPLP